MALWVLHAWAHDAAIISPVLAFVSPEKRCGKTTALAVVAEMTPKPVRAVNITPAVLFRVVEKYRPTVLLDEADTFLPGNDELPGIVNGGHNRFDSFVWRCVGDDHEPTQFSVWSPKCIAMIGRLPDTLEDRALVVPLRRKLEHEKVERFRGDRNNDFLDIRRKAQRWAEDNIEQLRALDPVVPDELDDRAQDNARAICGIADLCGGEWPTKVRNALVGLARAKDDEPQSRGILLLEDIKTILESRGVEAMRSSELESELVCLEERPWGELGYGKVLTTRKIASLLKPFDIKSRRNREGSFYHLSDFEDAFTRYLSDISATTATTATSATEKPNEINGPWQSGTCDTFFDPPQNNYHEVPSATDKGSPKENTR